MLLIFDLDDTLIPTSEEITPKKLELSLKRMIDSGLRVDFEEGKKRLFEMNEGPTRTSEVIKEFARQMEGSNEQLLAGVAALEESFGNVSPKLNFALNEFLASLRERFTLAIVTGGTPQIQNEKIDLYGIDRELFEAILVEEWGMKERSYRMLNERFGSFAVVGDRIENDLCGAKKIGGTTIHIRQGRGRFEPLNHPDVDFEIRTINELTEVLERI